MTALLHGDDPRLRRRSPRSGTGEKYYGPAALKRLLELQDELVQAEEEAHTFWAVALIAVGAALLFAVLITVWL